MPLSAALTPFKNNLETKITTKLKSALKSQDGVTNSNTAVDNLAAEIAKALAPIIAQEVNTFVKQAMITIPSGAIAVVGSPSAQANPAPIVLTGVIS
jgi:hypothetical protein